MGNLLQQAFELETSSKLAVTNLEIATSLLALGNYRHNGFFATIVRDLENLLPHTLIIASFLFLSYLTVCLICYRSGIGSSGISLGSIVLTHGRISISSFSSFLTHLLLPNSPSSFSFINWRRVGPGLQQQNLWLDRFPTLAR